jgi:hypothetical protein
MSKSTEYRLPSEEQDVVGIDCAHRVVQTPVERPDDVSARIARLVDWVVAGDPWVVAVATCHRLPQMHDAILGMSVRPEQRPMRRVVAVPALVLGAGQCVQIDDRVEPMPRTALDRAVEEQEPALVELEGSRVVLEVAVVDGEPDRVEPERGDERGIGVGKEHVE